MKKILFVLCVISSMVFVSCGRCNEQTSTDQDTIVVNDTVVYEQFDTMYVD